MIRLRELPCDHHVVVMADQGDETAGYAAVRRRDWLRPDWREAEVWVAPRFRGGGVGRRLWAYLDERTPPERALYAVVKGGDSRSLAVARGWGFTPFQVETKVSLDVRHAPDAPACPGLVTRRTLDGAARDEVDALMRACDSSPEAGVFMASGIATLPPAWRPHVITAAGRDGRPVGICIADRVNDHHWHIRFTGVRPEARGRGVATGMKRLLHAQARDDAVRWVTATNAESNDGVRALNARLGYVRFRFGWRLCRTSAPNHPTTEET